jgi:type III pantothenate kinase
MLLAVDVGNTNTVLGVFGPSPTESTHAGHGQSALHPASASSTSASASTPASTSPTAELLAHWRLETRGGRTADEYALALHGLMAMTGLGTAPRGRLSTFTGAIIATVVPSALFPLERLCRDHLGTNPLVVGPGIKTGMPILAENPREVGADRIVNAVAAYERVRGDHPGSGCIVVDFGTATTFDVITPRGEYLGGAIAPGITISADALYARAAKLPRVEIARPRAVVGKNTVASMQSGLYYGYVGLVDGIVTRMLDEIGFPAQIIATGGLAPLVARDSRTIQSSDEMLTLVGMHIIYHRNRTSGAGEP